MDINIGTNVNYEVTTAAINTLIVVKGINNSLTVVAPYLWKDRDGKIVRSGTQTYQESNLIKGLGVGVFTALKNLILALITKDGISQNLVINLTSFSGNTGSTVKTDGKSSWQNKPISSIQFAEALTANGLNLDAFKAIISGMAQSIFD